MRSNPIANPKLCLLTMALLTVATSVSAAEDDQAAAVRKSAGRMVASFNAGKADEVAAVFLPKGELIDEQGTVFQGPQEIKDLLGAFFKKFPAAKLAVDTESIRLVGPVAIEEGARTMTTADGAEKSHFRYIAVWSKGTKDWQLASFRDFADDPLPTPHESLEPLSRLVGDWINEGADGKVTISYRWSDDQNYLLGEFETTPASGTPRKSSQRIGWDPSVGRIRSWLFDTDGGFAEGNWTVVDDGIVIKSSSVNPDGTTASATMNVIWKDRDHYSIEGTDRIVGNTLEEDFELTVTRRAPPANK
ncbi:MAG TPA: SgcJ/EcaC family oxidoreductase [Pirellulales bacterium]